DVLVDQHQVARGPIGEAGHGIVGDAHHVSCVVLLDGDDHKRSDLSDTLDPRQARLLEHMPAPTGGGKTTRGTAVLEAQGGIAEHDRIITVIDGPDLHGWLRKAGRIVAKPFSPGSLSTSELRIWMHDLAFEHGLSGRRKGQA